MMFSRRDQDIQRLEQEVQRLQRLLQEVQETTANHIALLQQQLANKSLDVERLQAKLQSQQDYEKIKTELRSLRALQDADDRHVDWASPPSDGSRDSAENDSEIQTEVKASEFAHSVTAEEALNESCSVICGGSPASSLSLQTLIKEEVEADADVGSLDEDEHELDTAGVAQQVKEALQRRNIGQRVFGHYVLGLSQGSVSDILARPKPWRKLTSRGREPFLRMKHFLSDEHGIQTLSIIQERLRGLVPWVRPADSSSDQAIRNILDQSRLEMLEDDMRAVRGGEASEHVIRNILQEAKQQMQDTSRTTAPLNQEEVHCGTEEPRVRSSADFVQSVIQKVKYEIDEDSSPWSTHPDALQTGSGGRAQVCCRSRDVHTDSAETDERPADISSGLELQALELDTLAITHRVKDTLMIHNIGQRVFGEEVLGLTQSSVSELLSHPKPWSKLSQKGKENFIRMHLWLRDPHSVQKLNAKKKMDQRARLKRDSLRMLDAVRQEFGLGDSGASEGIKRPRVVLGLHEKEVLRSAYQLEPYPSQHTIERLASQLGLLTSTVSNWFYNYRSRIRRDGYCEPVQARHVQSPAGSSPVSGSLVPIKPEPSDPDLEEEAERQRDRHTCVSVGVQSVPRVKPDQEEEEEEEDLPSVFLSLPDYLNKTRSL